MIKQVSGLVLAVSLLTTGAIVVADPASAAAKPKVYKNCAALNKKYKHGAGLKGAKDKVKSGKAVTNFTVIDKAFYKANKNRDKDKDNILCEKR